MQIGRNAWPICAQETVMGETSFIESAWQDYFEKAYAPFGIRPGSPQYVTLRDSYFAGLNRMCTEATEWADHERGEYLTKIGTILRELNEYVKSRRETG